VKNYQSTVSVAIYFTKKNAANYVDDQGCKKLGEFLEKFQIRLGIGLRFLLPHVFEDHAWIRQILAEYVYHRYTA
jgi:hypothetical protein